jgi:hypothetical protein
MRTSIVTLFASLLAYVTSASAFSLSDTLYIEDYYSQQGRSIGRNKLENFLLNQNLQSAQFADKAKGLRLSAWAIGTPLWCVNTGYSIYQIKKFVDAINNQQIPTTSLSSYAMPLFIAGDVTLFIQNFLRNRSDYAIHRAVVAYNSKIAEKLGPDSLMDHRIRKNKWGWYTQDRVFLPGSVLYPVLKEKEASRPLAYWSSATGLVADQTISIGIMFLAIAAMGYMDIEGVSGSLHERQVQLGVGIGLTSFGIIGAVISGETKKSAIRKYNAAVNGN